MATPTGGEIAEYLEAYARTAVIATGAFQEAIAPPFAARLDAAVVQFTTET